MAVSVVILLIVILVWNGGNTKPWSGNTGVFVFTQIIYTIYFIAGQ